MNTSRYSASRQKSCDQCSTSKAKCDRQSPCARCAKRSLSCVYPKVPSGSGEFPGGQAQDDSLDGSDHGTRTSFTSSRHEVLLAISTDDLAESSLNFGCLDLLCPINVEDISNRWLNPYIPGPEQTIKSYPVTVINYIWRILNSYAASASRGRGILPFIHPAQMNGQTASSPLNTCLSLIRISEHPLPGTESAAALVLQREMESIAATREKYDDMALLAAYQAYLIYALVLFFRLSQGSSAFFRQAMMTLQELACSTSRRGLVCTADRHHTRPKWEEWIVTESKRRTLYVMYLFDSILSSQENLPTFLGTELRGLPAPANKLMWQAQARRQWEKEYNVSLTEWTRQYLTIDELWPMPPGLDAADIAERRDRVNRWLENMDEFGTMLFAVTSCTHG
ncbi:uncharacterized protein N7496_008123 [Penicillium cataractarum]|uniref:Zn(2)-C6 fungal-type domain-containing protein n=1 Tax=Penicillium cataractarum TaxID=2100454 RepID=A0A9W9V490_9EURO|nr:uncharacterized protein N7496_008123 [Penicillium cataractarum]KAJ5368363.1 hypothetical protein N7496_008123 [Penicillium cataractarum]